MYKKDKKGGQKRVLGLILAITVFLSLFAATLDFLLNSATLGKKSGETGGINKPNGGTGSKGCESCNSPGSGASESAGNGGKTGKLYGSLGESDAVSRLFGGEIPVNGCPNPPHVPLFEIRGVPGTSYLRSSVGEVYRSGSWDILENSSRLDYQGGSIEQRISGYSKASYVKFSIAPLVEIGGFIPSVKNPLRLSLGDGQDIYYYPSQQLFFSKTGIRSDYDIEYVNYEFDERALTFASTPNDPRYLDVPSELLPALKPLAQKIVENYGAKTPYEKLKAIETYLRNNYVYDKNYTPPPKGYDPILWFLFHEKKGVCVHFNSAFVLLARTLGLPARLVTGFYVDRYDGYQIVYADQAHAYAEVLFNGFGWITFDATGVGGTGRVVEESEKGSRGIGTLRTTTEIVYVDEVGIKGSTFRVFGKVSDERGSAVSGLVVKVYLKRSKNSDERGILVGQGIVEKGIFNITCLAPLNVTVGKYSVIAETIGRNGYLGSQSDPEIRIMAKTQILPNYPEKVIAGRKFSISGILKEVDSDLPVRNKLITLIFSSREYRILTDDAGRFSIDLSISEPGNYTLVLNFGGDENYLASKSEIRLRVLSLRITPLTNSTLIRGENAEIAGIVHAEDLAGDNEFVTVYFDGFQVARVKSDSSGRFIAKYSVPNDYPLGSSAFRYQLQSNGFEVVQNVRVMARTHMKVKAPEEPVEHGKTFRIAVSLLNDHEKPVSGVMIVFNCTYQSIEYSVSMMTDEKGETVFDFALPADREEIAKYKLTFPGNELYLGTEFTGNLKVAPYTSPAHYAYLLIAVIGAGTFFAQFLRRKRREKLMPESSGIKSASPTNPVAIKKSIELAIKFPDIREPFPLVWGVNEGLKVRVEIRKEGAPISDATVKLRVDNGEEICLKTSPSGDAEAQLIFTEKGIHRLKAYFAVGDELNEAEANIKIVDYREEIVQLFNSFIKSTLKKYQWLQESMTAREILYRLLKEVPESKRNYLKVLVSIFEVADYSLRPISRAEYERFFLAKLALEEVIADGTGKNC
jgi:transglutaminase-like putative cysteine protease